jgi:hypothetical protein
MGTGAGASDAMLKRLSSLCVREVHAPGCIGLRGIHTPGPRSRSQMGTVTGASDAMHKRLASLFCSRGRSPHTAEPGSAWAGVFYHIWTFIFFKSNQIPRRAGKKKRPVKTVALEFRATGSAGLKARGGRRDRWVQDATPPRATCAKCAAAAGACVSAVPPGARHARLCLPLIVRFAAETGCLRPWTTMRMSCTTTRL